MLKTCSMGVIHEIILAPVVNFVIFMAQKTIGELSPAEKKSEVYKTLSNSPKC